MMASNDVRHIQKLMLAKDERPADRNDFEAMVLNGENMHFHRLLCGHLYEAGSAFRDIDRAHPHIANSAVAGTEYEDTLRRLREAFAQQPPGAFHHSFLKAVRDKFGFHYLPEAIRPKLDEFVLKGEIDAVAIHAELSGLSRYLIADFISLGILQDILNAELPALHEAFDNAMGKVLDLARDLSDIVDLMLLPLLERDQSAIIKREAGTLSVQVELTNEKQQLDELITRADHPEQRSDEAERDSAVVREWT
jgi:hypothetical protein